VSNDDPRGLWIIAMDGGLRLLYIEPLLGQLTADVDDYADDIEMFLDGQPEVEYFVVAWSTDVVREREPGWLRRLDDRLRELMALGSRRLLGQVVFDPQSMFASVPRCDFSLEPDLAGLPRAMAIAGPHGLDCPCPPCVADRRAFDDSYSYSDDSYGSYDGSYPYGPYGDEPDADGSQGDVSFSGATLMGPPPRYGGGRRRRSRRYPWQRSRQVRALELVGRGGEEPDPFDEPEFDPVWKRWYPDPERAYKRWTFDEEVEVVRSHFAGLSCFDISILVRRQPSAIASRLRKLGIPSNTIILEHPTSDATPSPNPRLDAAPPDR